MRNCGGGEKAQGSSRGRSLNLEPQYGSSQLSVTPAPADTTPFFRTLRAYTYMMHKQPQAYNK